MPKLKLKLADAATLSEQVRAQDGRVEMAEARRALAAVNPVHLERLRKRFDESALDLDPKDVEAFKTTPDGANIDSLFESSLLLQLSSDIRAAIDGAVQDVFAG
jgi:hypothetical protein